MTSGGFESGADYVAAKVVVDVDGQGIQSLRELSQEIDRLRTSTEAGARSSASFTSYIQQMVAAAKQATEAHRDLSGQLERTAESQMRGTASGSSSQALTSSRLAPGGFVDGFAGMGAGMGGSRGPSPTDVQHQIDPTRQLDPRKYINAQAGRYNINPGEMPTQPGQADWGSHANRIAQRDQAVTQQQRATSPSQASGGGQSGTPEPESGGTAGEGAASRLGRYSGYGRLASNIANEMAPGGGTWGSMGRVLQGGMRGIGQHMSAAASGTGAETAAAAATDGAEASEGMGIGSLVKGAGGIGLALGGLAAVQKGGAMYQGYKNMGLIRGQGAGAGFGDEAAIRTMALNPFLSTEQSRQIIMAGLTEGYSGKQFDSVTEFMASNLKNMNVSVSDSVQMLRKNVNEGGQSITGLASSLSVLKGLAANGSAMSLPDMTANFAQTSGALISGGMSGGAASQAAIEGMGVFGDDQVLKGSFNADVAQSGTAMGGAMIRAFGGANADVPAGLDPAATAMYMGDHGSSPGQATGAAYLKTYQQAFNAPGAKTPGSVQSYNALVRFSRLMAIRFPGNPAGQSLDAAKDLVSKLAGGQNPFDKGKQDAAGVEGQVNGGPGLGTGIMDQLSVGADIFTDGFKQISAMVTGNDVAYDNASAHASKDWQKDVYDSTAQSSNPIMDNVISQVGAGNIQVGSGDNWSDLSGSKQQISDFAAGKINWRQKGQGGDGYSVSQTPAMGNVGAGGNTNVSFSPAQVQITIDNQGNATANPSTATLTPLQNQVNAGVGTATLNNPDSGNGYDRGKNTI